MGTPGRTAYLALATAALATAGGCVAGRDDRAPPAELIDGSSAAIATVSFEGVDGPVVETRVRVHPTVAVPCGDGRAPGVRSVQRVGTLGSSVTMLFAAPRIARACDATYTGRWCGHAFARLRPGTQLDARLSVTCVDTAGSPVGFAWVDALRDAFYVVVAHAGYAEAYEVHGAGPVRVSTRDVDLTRSAARFAVSEHDAAGRRLRSYVLEPRVAG